jgi:5-formyltetrahydrofolate cyclo-ligase
VTLFNFPAMNSTVVAERQRLRHALLARRDALSYGYRLRAARRVLLLLQRSQWFRAHTALGLYASQGAELDTRALRQLAQRRGCRVFLPRISSYQDRRMRLCAERGTALRANRYGIAEPPAATGIAAARLDVLFLPVVGFDSAGNRLGMGAGYYDRYLKSERPLLVGLAYDCAGLRTIPAMPHDVPLNAIVTESGIRYFQGSGEH